MDSTALTMNATVSASSSGGISVGGSSWYYPDFQRTWPIYKTYPYVSPGVSYVCTNTHVQPNKIEQSFKVASVLLEKGIVADMTLKDFIALVMSIAEALE